jgi:hypothetical protein
MNIKTKTTKFHLEDSYQNRDRRQIPKIKEGTKSDDLT